MSADYTERAANWAKWFRDNNNVPGVWLTGFVHDSCGAMTAINRKTNIDSFGASICCSGCRYELDMRDPSVFTPLYATTKSVLGGSSSADLVASVAAVDVPITTNEHGGSQSHIPVRFDLIDGPALFAMAAVLHEGAEKYGADNWRKISAEDSLNHMIMHAYAWLSGDRSDDHLPHIMCRGMFATAVDLRPYIPPEGVSDG